MSKKVYTVKSTRYFFGERPSRETVYTGTLDYLIHDVFGYTLECGASWEHEEGNYKVNVNPKSGAALVNALNKAEHNCSRICQMTFYELVTD